MRDSYRQVVIYIVYMCLFTILVSCVEAQDIQDISGKWTVKFEGVEDGCQDIARNGSKEGVFVFTVTQSDDSIYAVFRDGDTTNVLTGEVEGNSIEATVSGSTFKGCNVRTVLLGNITGGDRINGTYSGYEISCETCRWEGEFIVTITR